MTALAETKLDRAEPDEVVVRRAAAGRAASVAEGRQSHSPRARFVVYSTTNLTFAARWRSARPHRSPSGGVRGLDGDRAAHALTMAAARAPGRA
jgi:hypothetical protein